MRQRWRIRFGSWLLAVAALCPVAAVQAETRAWLDRATVGDGETVTLNIESDQTGAAPDYAPLQADFALSGQTSSRQVRWDNGNLSSKALFGVALTPRRSGTLEIPSLRVGNERTAPLRLQVQAGAPATQARRGDEAAFIETDVDDAQPYVQQSVGVVVRLYFATQLASGELVLDTPAGASLQRVGEDRSLVREVGGRRYNVVERRFLLIPERSGPLQLDGARFNGRGVGGFFDDFFGRGNGQLSARGPARTLQVQAQPDGAPQPWLPLQDLRLRYTATPQAARVGEAATLVLEAVATGATRAQFPELPVPSLGDAAQVFAEPAQYDETFVGGSPQLKLTRRYSIVPQQAGTLRLSGIGMDWWDVASGRARKATVPDLEIEVAAGRGGLALPPPALPDAAAAGSSVVDDSLTLAPHASAPAWPWIALAAGFALLWLLTLAWALRRGRGQPAREGAPTQPRSTSHGLPDLRRALEAGGLDEVERILCDMAGVAELDAVVARLQDPAQREALQRMQRARWGGGGDVAAARRALREALRDGPRWQAPAKAEKSELPPLYPADR
ncbi:BatD family protein [Flavobacterium sp. MXW15]|uniref:BatD family protein n=1 Tax=Xanthomonas chitinilytica TaxID=2989819 RepID=A0ABT3JTR9_9XANT|nr:BatD family protein [Xanthomonas sp. H13-6]MCW4454648.1 BatD family protein [Flavobacterium sp. MXW15]MCW4471887.1 BatD family protein [Xanthomonas sp. H13-6]